MSLSTVSNSLLLFLLFVLRRFVLAPVPLQWMRTSLLFSAFTIGDQSIAKVFQRGY